MGCNSSKEKHIININEKQINKSLNNQTTTIINTNNNNSNNTNNNNSNNNNNTNNNNNNNPITPTNNNTNNNNNNNLIKENKFIIDVKSKSNKLFYDGIYNNMAIYCLDIFNSKYTGEKMGRWRAAHIVEFNSQTLKVHIHFDGWKDKHDIFLSLPDDLGRLAPSEILNDQQKLDGELLSETQYEATQVYLQTGHLQIDDTILKNGDVFHLEEQLPTYQIDQLVDVLDIYKTKNKANVVHKWRPGKIKDINGPHIVIHYIGWGDEWDEVINSTIEFHRIRPSGTSFHSRGSPTKLPAYNTTENREKLSSSKNSKKREQDIASYRRRKSYSNSNSNNNNNNSYNNNSYNNIIVSDENSSQEQRRGSFTISPTVTSSSNLNSNSTKDGNYERSGKVDRRKISVQSINTPIPESEQLIDPEQHHSGNNNIYNNNRMKNGRQSSKISVSSNPNPETESNMFMNDHNPYQSGSNRELFRTHSYPGPDNKSKGQQSSITSTEDDDDDDEPIPSEIDESEYYETLKKEKEFFEAMNKKGYHIVEMDGDGNCLFRSVAHQIYLDEDRHHELRLQTVNHLKKHYKRFSSFYVGNFMEYLDQMSNLGVWGDDLEIKALEEITDRVIHIFSSSNPSNIAPLLTNFNEDKLMKNIEPILLSYHGRNHYNSVYNERVQLPLEQRNSTTLLEMRCKIFNRQLSYSQQRLGYNNDNDNDNDSYDEKNQYR